MRSEDLIPNTRQAVDKQQRTLMFYSAVYWHEKTDLFFVEGHASGQEGISEYKRKKKTIDQKVYHNYHVSITW